MNTLKNKLLLFIPFILLLSGCTVEYTIDFQGENVIEKIEGDVSDEEAAPEVEDRSDVNQIYYNLYLEEYPLINNANEKYVRNVTDIDGGKHYKFNYIYYNNYKDSKIINSCFENRIYEETDDFYYINLTGKFTCLYGDKVDILVRSEKAVLEDNANSVKNGTYKWVIDKENSDNVNILLSVSKNIDANYKEYKVHTSPFKIIAFIILIVLSVITYLLYRKKEKNGI